MLFVSGEEKFSLRVKNQQTDSAPRSDMLRAFVGESCFNQNYEDEKTRDDGVSKERDETRKVYIMKSNGPRTQPHRTIDHSKKEE